MMKGLVLAGGKSSRFGSNKALATYQGQTFLERSIQLLREMDLEVVVAASKDQEYSLGEAQIITDTLAQKGPLGGIYSAMSYFSHTDFLVLTCDTPEIDPNILKRLLHYYCGNEALFYTSDADEIEPFPGIYPGSLKELLGKRISEDRLSMKGFIGALDNKNTLLFERNAKKIMNVNTVKEWELLNS